MAQDSILLNGSICLTDLITHAKNGHSAFVKGAKNGKIYFNFSQWVNVEPDQYKNHSSILLNSSKENKAEEGKIYIGNAKKSEYQPEPITDDDKNALDLNGADIQGIGTPGGEAEKLPF